MAKLQMLKPRLATSTPKLQPTTSWGGAKSSSALYGVRWRKLRASFLLRNPLCVHCRDAGKITPANEVDHIIPHRGDMEKFYDQSNLQGLCKPCHSRKTATEDGGFGNI